MSWPYIYGSDLPQKLIKFKLTPFDRLGRGGRLCLVTLCPLFKPTANDWTAILCLLTISKFSVRSILTDAKGLTNNELLFEPISCAGANIGCKFDAGGGFEKSTTVDDDDADGKFGGGTLKFTICCSGGGACIGTTTFAISTGGAGGGKTTVVVRFRDWTTSSLTTSSAAEEWDDKLSTKSISSSTTCEGARVVDG
uniref:Uncharacterized protein n=1 Tax=Romanomermis culicivorax TaxID=13658 RepID=A0A915IIR3_ROMCU